MNTSQHIALGFFTAALCTLGQNAIAHPSLSLPTITEGTNAYTAVTITHGLTAFTPPAPVTGTVQFFPTGADSNKKGPGRLTLPNGSVQIIDGGVASVRKTTDASSFEVGTQTNLADEIVSSKGGATGVATLAGKFRAVSSKAVFGKIGAIKTADGTSVIGAWGYQGKLDPDLYAQTTFRANMSGVWFNKDKCAKSLKVRVAAADVGKSDRTNAGTPHGYVNAWFNSQTPKFTDTTLDGITPDVNFWMTLTVPRDTTNNPFPKNSDGQEICKDTDKYDVVVTPTFEEIDTFLKIPNYWADK
jgi:hypothetical protein